MARHYTPLQLTDELQNWWLNLVDKAGIARGPGDKINISRNDNYMMVKLPSEFYVLGFDVPTSQEVKTVVDSRLGRLKSKKLPDERTLRPESVFVAHVAKREIKFNVSLEKMFFENQKAALQLGDQIDKARYKSIFHAAVVSYGPFEFGDSSYSGLSARVPILELPRGEHGGLSEHLFSDTRRFIVKPLVQAYNRVI